MGKGESTYFVACVMIAEALLVMALIMLVCWLCLYFGGFGWTDDPSVYFNYHPVFMFVGFIFLNGQAVLVYRVFTDTPKIRVKILHAVLQVGSLFFVFFGLGVVVSYKNIIGMGHFDSGHSWMGITLVVIFTIQWICGFCVFLMPYADSECRRWYLSLHVSMGVGIFWIAITTSLLGIAFKTTGQSGPALSISNWLCIVLMALGLLITYILLKPEFARKEAGPSPEADELTPLSEKMPIK